MKAILAILTAAGVMWTASASMASGPAPARYDLDGDGVVSILDMASLANHLYEHAEPCAHAQITRYETPVTAIDEYGEPYRVSGRAVPVDHIDEIIAGTPVAWC